MASAAPPPSPSSAEPLTAQVGERDPWLWCVAIPLVFAALASIRLTIPSAPYFDEVHYLPAAREFLKIFYGNGAQYFNREHPLLGKEIIALSIYALGDNPLGWRLPSLVAGATALGASMRALWHASGERTATIAFGVLLATGFPLFVHARIAMLDIFMVAFLALATWQFAAAIAEPERGRWRLALTSVALGLAMGAKWNAAPMAMIPGLTFFAARLSAGRRRLILSRRGLPVPGVSLAEAFVWLGVVPLAVYALTFAPGYWLGDTLRPSPLAKEGFLGFHAQMLTLQNQVLTPHTYQSTWPQWALNTRGIWYLYEFTDNAQRGVMLIGNPLTSLLGLPALVWCLLSGLARSNWARVGVVVGYGAALGLWVIAPKPVQFFYHYTVPSCFLFAALALALSDLHRTQAYRWAIYAVPFASAALFATFFPILTAAPLEGPLSFAWWTWLNGWR